MNRKDAEGYERPVYEIEVDEVVECQECKYYEAGRENEPDYCSRHSEWVRRDFFCGDAERIKHGHWYFEEYPSTDTTIRCVPYANCGLRGEAFLEKWKTCPNCGAKMDEVVE